GAFRPLPSARQTSPRPPGAQPAPSPALARSGASGKGPKRRPGDHRSRPAGRRRSPRFETGPPLPPASRLGPPPPQGATPATGNSRPKAAAMGNDRTFDTPSSSPTIPVLEPSKRAVDLSGPPLEPYREDGHGAVGGRVGQNRHRQRSGPLVEAGQEEPDQKDWQEIDDIEVNGGKEQRAHPRGVPSQVPFENGIRVSPEKQLLDERRDPDGKEDHQS